MRYMKKQIKDYPPVYGEPESDAEAAIFMVVMLACTLVWVAGCIALLYIVFGVLFGGLS